MKIKVKELRDAFLIMMLIWFSGSLFYKNHDDAFLLFTMAYSAWSIFRRIGRLSRSFKKGAGFCLVLLASCLITVFVTHGSLSIATSINVVLHFLFTFCVVEDVGGEKGFIKKYCSVVYYLAIISLLLFAVQLVFPNILRSVFIHKRIPNSTKQDFYTIGIFTMVSNHTTRNCGMMTEPGLYQIILNTALFFLFFLDCGFSSKKKWKQIIILSITILSAQTAVGILNYGVLVFCYLIHTNKRKRGKINNAKIIIVGIGVVIMMIITFGPSIPAISHFTSKLFVDGKLNVSGGSGRYRMISMLTDLEVFRRNILGAGYDDYYKLFSLYKVENTVINASSCGLTYCLAIFGIFTYVLIMGYYFVGFMKSPEKLFVKISILTVFLFTSWAQPLIYYPVFIAAIVVIRKRRGNLEIKGMAII